MMPTVKVDTKGSIFTVFYMSINIPPTLESDRNPAVRIHVNDIFKKKLRKFDIT